MGPSHVLLDGKSCFDLNESNSLFVLLGSAKLMQPLLSLSECISLNLGDILQEDTICTVGKGHCTCRDQTEKGVRVILLPCLSSSWTHVNAARGFLSGR